jgi:triosephosphate isomerase
MPKHQQLLQIGKGRFTMTIRKPLYLGNFKAHNMLELRRYSAELSRWLNRTWLGDSVDVGFAPGAIQLATASTLLEHTPIWLGLQSIYPDDEGPYTGETSGNMVKEFDLNFIIIGHSERRSLGVTNELVVRKVRYVLDAFPLATIVLCIGEPMDVREDPNGQYVEYVLDQLRSSLPEDLTPEEWLRIVPSYEPVWANESSRSATKEQVQEMHAAIRNFIREWIAEYADKVRIIYGGEVTAENSAEIILCQDVDGALVDDAALNLDEFLLLIENAMSALSQAKAL